MSVVDESRGARVDAFYLGAKDENSVQGFAGTPVNVNALTYGYLNDVGAAGAAFPRQQHFFVSVDSLTDRFNGAPRAGRYVLRSWVDDVTPPTVRLLTTRVSAGRPTIVLQTLDSQSGVDPVSLTVGFHGILVGAESYDPESGVAVFPLPASVPALSGGSLKLRFVASDFQEAKNIDTVGPSIMPNTRTASARLTVVAGTAVDWILPMAGRCLKPGARLVVAASSTRRLAHVRFVLDRRQVGDARHGTDGLWGVSLPVSKLAAGKHTLVAAATDGNGRLTSVTRIVRACTP